MSVWPKTQTTTEIVPSIIFQNAVSSWVFLDVNWIKSEIRIFPTVLSNSYHDQEIMF